MKTTLLKLALGLTVATLGALPASADGYGGGLKGLRGSYVPVPAPTPIPEYKAKWYLRADVGVGFGTGAGLTENGLQYGQNDVGNTDYNAIDRFAFGDPAYFDSFFTDKGHDTGYAYGVGAGFYVTNNFRMDVTFELRQDKEPTLNGDFSYIIDANNDGFQNPILEEAVLEGSIRDRFRLRSGVFMANAYYDVSTFGRLRPYIGGGLGFAVNEIERVHTGRFATCDEADCPTPVTVAGSPQTARDSGYTYSLAAQLTAGVSYEVWDGTHFDLNYRYLFVGGTDATLNVNDSVSKVEIEDQNEHYVRAGLRWDIY